LFFYSIFKTTPFGRGLFTILSKAFVLPEYEIVEYKSNYFYIKTLKILITNKILPYCYLFNIVA